MKIYDVIVIGAGIVGSSIARKLSHYNLKILVLESENDVAMGSTKSNSAIVHGGYAEAHEKLKGRLCYKGRTQFQKLNEELNFGFDPIGSMVLAFSEEELPKLQKLLENGKKNGLTDLEIIHRDEIIKIEPNINTEVKYALYCRGAGVTSPYEMAIALMENAIHNGVELQLNSEVIDITKNDDIFKVNVKGEKKDYFSKIVINAAGLYSQKISNMLGIDDFTINPRSGEYILFARGCGKLVNSVLFQTPTKMGKGILVTPTYHGNLLLGPDASNDDRIILDTYMERLLNIYKQAQKTTNKMDPSKFIKSFAGSRAVASTDDFIIREKINGFIECAGIQSPGLTSSPAIADMVAEMVGKIISLTPNKDFDPYRKPIIHRKMEMLPIKKRDELVKLESGDERLVCRCEEVSEKVIKDAISREIPINSIDAIKRRTRAGMGFCQSNFCRPRITSLMKKLLGENIDIKTDIEKKDISRVERTKFVKAIKSL